MDKIKAIFCVFFGHSRIVSTFFGYVYCGRCEYKIGDNLAGFFDLSDCVIIGHECNKCEDNYKQLSWKDKMFISYKKVFPGKEAK